MAASPVEWMRRCLPPEAVVHVGAGSGAGALHAWRDWDVRQALLVDADRDRLAAWAEPLLAVHPGWRMAGVALAEAEGEFDFHRASNPSEDGLIAPEQLTALWPNLHTVARSPRLVRRLDAVLDEAGNGIAAVQGHVWAVIDCLPAGPILQGAGECLAQWSVLWLRVLLRPTGDAEQGALLQHVAGLLAPLGFRCVDVQEGNHPAIGHALFARDWRHTLHERVGQLHGQSVQLAQDMAVLAAHNARLEQDKALLAAQHGRLEQDRQDLGLLNEAQRTQLVDDARLFAGVQAERSQMQTAFAALREQWAGQLALAEEQQARLDALQQSQAQLLQDKATLVTLGQALADERDGHAARLDQQQQHADALGAAQRQLESALTATVARRDGLEQELRVLAAVQTAQEAQLGESQQTLEALAQERSDLLARLAAAKADAESLKLELGTVAQQCEGLSEANAVLTGQRDQQAEQLVQQRALIDGFTAERQTLELELAQRQSAIEDLSAQCRELQAQATDWRLQAEVRTQETAAQGQQIASQVGQIDMLLQQLEALRQQTEAASTSHDTLIGVSAERQTLFDALTAENRQLNTRLGELEADISKRSEAWATAETAWKEKEVRFAGLEAESNELERRQQGISDEMLRAGAQIDLIKDILFQGALLAEAAPAAAPAARVLQGDPRSTAPGRKRKPAKP